MNKILRLKKSFKNLQQQLLIIKILLVVKENNEYEKQIKKLDFLNKESTDLMITVSDDNLKNFNYIDNNLFEMEQLLEDIKVEITDSIKVEQFVYLNNKSIEELQVFLEYFISLKNETSIFTARNEIIEYGNHILNNFIDKIRKYLLDHDLVNLLPLLNQDVLVGALNIRVPLIDDWKVVYKIAKTIIKSIDTSYDIEVLENARLQFEYAYFLVIMEV